MPVAPQETEKDERRDIQANEKEAKEQGERKEGRKWEGGRVCVCVWKRSTCTTSSATRQEEGAASEHIAIVLRVQGDRVAHEINVREGSGALQESHGT